MQDIIKKYNIKAKKSLWQNFLMDENILNFISAITNISWENIIEVWPWFWALTNKLISQKPKSLTLVELDQFMINILNDRLNNWDFDIENIDFNILNNDILKYSPTFDNYKIIANIPYYITSPILFRFLYDVEKLPNEMVILMQKEVWEKILSDKSSVLSLFIKRKCEVKKEIIVPKTSFEPSPKVDSIVLSFKLKQNFSKTNQKEFLSFIKASFSNPRKKMINNLWQFGYNKNQILDILLSIWYNENTRSEELKIQDFELILDKLK